MCSYRPGQGDLGDVLEVVSCQAKGSLKRNLELCPLSHS